MDEEININWIGLGNVSSETNFIFNQDKLFF
jgi:hypothetical protein